MLTKKTVSILINQSHEKDTEKTNCTRKKKKNMLTKIKKKLYLNNYRSHENTQNPNKIIN